ncbi:EAL domain-containing protein [Vibrio diazotrophicus]|uniref:EAL domain-containing protein n=1 Tax=Vibrio diazotrophicus TaxID=685 RepID=UPI0009DE2787|nr:EAL domain-containing protein [Vibrio diazotrophicus]
MNNDVNVSKGILSRAIYHNQFISHYQPKRCFSNGSIIGYESLIRWHHPEHGIVSPAHFLSQIYWYSLQEKLFFISLENSISDYVTYEFSGTMSVNVDYYCLQREGFHLDVAQVCKKYDFTMGNLVLEITEVEDSNLSNTIVSNINELIDLGVKFSIDDFGIGYSSLWKLLVIPFSELKIDRSFISRCVSDYRANCIVNNAVELGSKLKMIVVAEGVEDSDTWSTLRDIGVDVCQGYFTGKPMRPNEVNKRIHNIN